MCVCVCVCEVHSEGEREPLVFSRSLGSDDVEEWKVISATLRVYVSV